MKNIVRLIFLILVLFSCEKKTNIPNKIKIPEKLPVFVDGDSLCDIRNFIKQHDKTMFVPYNSDCSACIISLSLWLKFVEEHPEITPLLLVNTQSSLKAFWIQTYIYYQSPVYAVFDNKNILFSTNSIGPENDTFIVDSNENIILKGSIMDKKLKKEYTNYLKHNKSQ